MARTDKILKVPSKCVTPGSRIEACLGALRKVRDAGNEGLITHEKKIEMTMAINGVMIQEKAKGWISKYWDEIDIIRDIVDNVTTVDGEGKEVDINGNPPDAEDIK